MLLHGASLEGDAMIKLVMNDIDGVFGKFKKPDFPDQQDTLPYLDGLDKIKNIISAHKDRGVLHAACTGRAFHSIEPVMRYTGINAPSIFEHGTHIWIPREETHYRLVDKELPQLIEPSKSLEEWIRALDDKLLFDQFPQADIIRRRMENTHILTYEFRGVPTQAVYQALELQLPKEIKEYLDQKLLTTILSQSEIDGTPTGAIDVMPNLHKDTGVRHVLKAMQVRAEEVLGIEDSYHSGLPMMKEVGIVACPSNSQGELKDYVRKRNGFISDKPYADGWVQIMKTFT